MRRLALLIAGLATAVMSFSQGYFCDESDPFCTGTIYNFPAGTTGEAEPGPFYDCLYSQPGPAWYHMRILDPGNITIYMFSTPLYDIDFCCWGPFTDPFDPCPYGLTSQMVEDCSYSIFPEEYCDITGAQTGEYYILLITNYSELPCNITFSQISGTGSTDCTILPPPVNNNGPLCVGDTLQLFAADVVGATYYWSGPGGFLSTIQNPVIPNVTLANAGNYSCVITVGGQSSDPAVTSVVIYTLPMSTLQSDDTTVCIGQAAEAVFELTGWGPFSILYTDGTNEFTATGLSGPQDTVFLYPTAPTTYTFLSVSDLHCSRNLLLSDMHVNTNPAAAASLSGTSTLCSGETTSLTFNLAGTPPWEVTYTQNGGNPQTFNANSTPYILPVTPVVTTLYQISAANDFNCQAEISGEALVTVEPTPTVEAGADQTIAYGTSTTLLGVVTGGSGSYQYSWIPANKLVNPNVLQPATVNLGETTVFTLIATDNASGCSQTDAMTVTIEGGPLGCFPMADPQVICIGESSQLQALASGGSGEYTYLWTSNPPGFTSDIANPTVTPTQNTTYTVMIDDGFNVASGNVAVSVNERPVPEAGSDITIPHGAYTTLNGSAAGGSGQYSYHWEPADKLVDPDLSDPTTVNLTATTLFTLTVSDLETGCEGVVSDNMSVIVSGDALAVAPAVDLEEVCQGTTVQLFALAGGGSGNYDYTWTSNPPGYTSDLANPLATPLQTTVYTVVVNDGFNIAQGSVAVTVNPNPYLNLGSPDTIVCVYDTLTLNAGNPGSEYLWSNGSTNQTIKVGTTGIGFDVKSYSVMVTSANGCQSTDEITVIFDYSVCQGIGETYRRDGLKVYPNPGSGLFRISIHEEFGDKAGEIILVNILGEEFLPGHEIPDSSETFILDISMFPDGIYLIRVTGKSGRNYTARIILNK